jgi:hypothetical protein
MGCDGLDLPSWVRPGHLVDEMVSGRKMGLVYFLDGHSCHRPAGFAFDRLQLPAELAGVWPAVRRGLGHGSLEHPL